MDEPKICTDGDLFPEIVIPDQGPCSDSSALAFQVATEKYEAYKDSLQNVFENLYLAKCMKAYEYENFTVTAPTSEFHYTLYYYDQAGNLVRTVAPQGVDIFILYYSHFTLIDFSNFKLNAFLSYRIEVFKS